MWWKISSPALSCVNKSSCIHLVKLKNTNKKTTIQILFMTPIPLHRVTCLSCLLRVCMFQRADNLKRDGVGAVDRVLRGLARRSHLAVAQTESEWGFEGNNLPPADQTYIVLYGELYR